MVRVRIAPSPTGIPHLGNTRTTLFNFLFARHHKGKLVLRIEDTDQARIVKGAKEAISEILEWLGLIPDERYIQSERVGIYKKASQVLLSQKNARMDGGAVRFIVPKERAISWIDAVGTKTVSFKSDDVEDFIIFKSDGFPTYHLANVVDDHEMKISHVIRGDEWISSTPKHLLLYEAFNWNPPVFAHLPLILGPDKTKLSKRHGAKSALEYRDDGYLPEALNNFLALLGWNPGGDREIMSLNEMIELFDLKDVNTASPIFDIKKLEWMNGVYIRKSQISNLKSQILSQNSKLKGIDDKLLNKLVGLAQSRMKTLNDFEELIKPIIEEPSIKLTEEEKEIAKKLMDSFLSIGQPARQRFAAGDTGGWDSKTILAIIKDFTTKNKIKMQTLYKILTGKESGLPLQEMLEILGKEKVLKRLKDLIK